MKTITNKKLEIDYNQLDNEIAKFLGWFTQDGQYGTWFYKDHEPTAIRVAYSEHNNYPYIGLPFRRDWNYLIKVIEEIENTYHPHYDHEEYFTVDIFGCVCEISVSEGGEVQRQVDGYQYIYIESKLQSTYLAVGNFCKWYNNIKK